MTTHSKALAAVAGGTLAVALLAGCSNNTGSDAADDGAAGGPTAAPSSQDSSSPASASASESASGSATESASSSAPASAEGGDAIATAIETVEADGGQAVGIERKDNGGGRWELEVLDGEELFQIEVDSSGQNPGAREPEDTDAGELDRIRSATVPLAEALETARGEAADQDLLKAEIEDEDNVVVWKVEFGTDGEEMIEVLVDAASGEIVK
ncbi:PepSY domain-containing protein [Arthrobacter sp. KK5.5]|uniref:PepSY domain-containing protein n=1 Tax=Arthrobacter sp. KK5.5 TaxID=3373084 RepID=UPI003EE78DF0